MKLIDEKGRIFSKVNIVDLIVLVVIIALVAAVAVKFAGSRSSDDSTAVSTEEQYCYATIVARLQPEEVGEYLEVGDHLVANGNYTDAEIVDVKIEPAAYVGVNSDGLTVQSQHPIWKDITVVAKQKLDPSSVTLKLGGQEIRVGYDFILKTQDVETKAVIRGIEWKSE
jgi:hypothetical protein